MKGKYVALLALRRIAEDIGKSDRNNLIRAGSQYIRFSADYLKK